MSTRDPLVSTGWLAERLGAADLRVLDGSYVLPGDARDPKADFARAHIPGARFFDIDDIADERSALPHMLPSTEKFVARVRALGIGDGQTVVVYDQFGLFSAARVWWMFRVFGHERVAVLDGGLPKWLAENRPVEAETPPLRERHFTGARNGALVRDVTEVASAVKLGSEQIVDARAPGRFRGEEAEPRPGLRAGHIPGAFNVHYATLLNGDGTMKADGELRAAFEQAGVDLDRPLVTSCGTGVTAAILALALARLGRPDAAVYDGSWAEWGASDLGVERG